MKAKMKIGIGLKTKKKSMKKRILPIAKRGGFLPILPLLGGSLVGGAAGIAKAINDNKSAQRQLEELKHHNRVMEFTSLPTNVDEGSQQRKLREIKKKSKK